MQRFFDQELKDLNEKLIRMATLAEEMIKISIRILVDRKAEFKPEADEKETEVNRLQIETDENIVTLIARMQPVAKDLRFLIAASKINSNLERIADHAMNISQNSLILLQFPQLKPYVDLPLMADTVQMMMRKSLDAYVQRDSNLAREVLNTDDKVDALKDQIFRELLTYMISEPKSVQAALCLILIARNLERIADHATNIAEEVIYMVEGRDIRHKIEEERRSTNKK